MPYAPPKACVAPGCHNLALDGRYRCKEHLAEVAENTNARNRQRMANDPIWNMYAHRRWAHFKALLRAHGNVMCQKLTDGQPCRYKVAVYHHIISPRHRPDLFVVVSNVIGLCQQHHPNTDGTPDWKPGIDYTPTVLIGRPS